MNMSVVLFDSIFLSTKQKQKVKIFLTKLLISGILFSTVFNAVLLQDY